MEPIETPSTSSVAVLSFKILKNTDHIPFGSGAMPPHPKRGGKERAKLAVHEKLTKAKDTALLLT